MLPREETQGENIVRVLQAVTNMNIGGIETLLMSLYRRMDRSKVQFDFLLQRPQESYFENEILSLGGKIYRVPPFNPFHYVRYLHALQAFFTQYPEYKIVHTHNNALGMFVQRAAKDSGVPIRIAHSHTAAVPFDLKRSVFNDYCRLKINRFITYPFACSTAAGDWLYGSKLMHSGQVEIVRNGIEVDKFKFSQPVRNEIRTRMGLGDQLVFGHVGGFKSSKNHDFLLRVFFEALKSVPDAILLLVGGGELTEIMMQKARKMNISGQVRFLGRRSDVHELLQAMDVFLFPSLYEGLGIVLIEAQAAGLPCLASDTVPREARILDSFEWMSLREPAQVWAGAAVRMAQAGGNRHRSEEVKASGFDIAMTASWLQDFYIARQREIEGEA